MASTQGKTDCTERHTDGWDGYERGLSDQVDDYISKLLYIQSGFMKGRCYQSVDTAFNISVISVRRDNRPFSTQSIIRCDLANVYSKEDAIAPTKAKAPAIPNCQQPLSQLLFTIRLLCSTSYRLRKMSCTKMILMLSCFFSWLEMLALLRV